jgi:hypothetical protein
MKRAFIGMGKSYAPETETHFVPDDINCSVGRQTKVLRLQLRIRIRDLGGPIERGDVGSSMTLTSCH